MILSNEFHKSHSSQVCGTEWHIQNTNYFDEKESGVTREQDGLMPRLELGTVHGPAVSVFFSNFQSVRIVTFPTM